jgi:hypothetical protein
MKGERMAKRIWLLVAGVIVSIAIIRGIDGHMKPQPGGNSLQRLSRPAAVSEIVDGWKGSGTLGYAVAAVVADTLLLIPCYSLLLFFLLRVAAPRFAFLGLLAGAFDLVENAGIFIEMSGASGIAPLTHAVSVAKWAVATAALLIWLFCVRDWIKRLYALCLPIRFVVVDLAALAGALFVSDQGWDILRAIIEDNRQGEHYNLRLAAFLIISFVLALAIWFWSRHLLRFRPHAQVANPLRNTVTDPVIEDPGCQQLFEWLPRLLGLTVFLIEMAAIWNVKKQYSDGSPQSPQRFMVTILWLLAMAVAYSLFVVGRRKVLGLKQLSLVTTITSWRAFDRSTHVVFLVSLLVEIGLFVWALVCPVTWWVLGAGAVLILTISVWVPLGSVMVALGEQWRIPILTLLLIEAAIISPYADNHAIRELKVKGAPERITLEKALQDWVISSSAFPKVGNKTPMFIVATEGGGIRAAYWTATVLTELEDTFPGFSKHLFAISSVSGGAVGSTVYDALLASREEGAPLPNLKKKVREVLGFDALSGTLASLAQPDVAQRFVPIFTTDRAAALERGWEYGWRRSWGDAKTPWGDQFGGGVLNMFAKHRDLPLLFHNGTTVEMGDRMITAPVQFRNAIEFRNAHDALENFGGNVDLPLSTFAHMSARFPYVSPVGKIPNRDAQHAGLKRDIYAHVGDGGYFEVSAAVTASEIAAFVRRMAPGVEPHVIVIDYTKGKVCPPDQAYCAAYGITGPPPPPKVERYLNDALSPIRTVLAARDARGQQAVGDLANGLNAPKEDSRSIEFRLVKTTQMVPLPLGWVLSNQAMNAIDHAVACDPNNRKAASVVGQLMGSPVNQILCDQKMISLPPPAAINCDGGVCGANQAKSSVYSDDE